MLRHAVPIVLPATLALLLVACGQEAAAPAVPRPALVVQPQPTGASADSYPGEVRARFEPELAFRIGGKVSKRLVEEGQRVRADQPLAELDPQDVRLQLEANRAQLAAAEANLALVRAERDRYQKLLERQMVSRSQYDNAKNLYVADTENGRIQVFDANGKYMREIRPAGRDSFRFPRSVTYSPANHRLYVVDEMDNRIYVFDMEGKQVQVWDRRRSQSEAPATPGRMAVSPNGVVYVSEPNNRRVMVYTSNHVFTAALGAGGELQSPSGLAVGPRGMLFVLDSGLCRAQVYDNKGKPAMAFGRRGMGPGEFSVPRDLAVDRGGSIVVADTLNHRLQFFDPQGQYVSAFGAKGKADGEFAGPEGVAISPDDWLYVSDRGNARVQVFQIER